MTRGLLFFVLQFALVLIIGTIGVVALLRPRLVQSFLNINFYLLPPPSRNVRVIPVAIMLFGTFMVYYGVQLTLSVKQEIMYVIQAVRALTG